MDASRLFRRDGQCRRDEEMALYVMEGIECLEVTVGNGTVESLWVRIKGQINNAGVTVGVSFGSPRQDNDANKYSLRN